MFSDNLIRNFHEDLDRVFASDLSKAKSTICSVLALGLTLFLTILVRDSSSSLSSNPSERFVDWQSDSILAKLTIDIIIIAKY